MTAELRIAGLASLHCQERGFGSDFINGCDGQQLWRSHKPVIDAVNPKGERSGPAFDVA